MFDCESPKWDIKSTSVSNATEIFNKLIETNKVIYNPGRKP